MIQTCNKCQEDFLTEADPYIVTPTSKGYILTCTCVISKLQKERNELIEALEKYRNMVSEYRSSGDEWAAKDALEKIK